MQKMCGKALKSELAFQKEDIHEIQTRYIARGPTFADSKIEGDAGAVCPAARTRLHPAPDIDF